MDEMLQPIRDLMRDLLQNPNGEAKLCQYPGTSDSSDVLKLEKQKCESCLLGTTVRSLVRHNMFPIPSSKDVSRSLALMSSMLGEVFNDMKVPPEPKTSRGYAAPSNHTKCNPAESLLQKKVDVGIKSNQTTFQAHMEHMTRQQKKSGLSLEE